MSADKTQDRNKPTAVVDPAGQVLSNRVTQLRKNNKLTLDQLAAASGVSGSMLSKVERPGQPHPGNHLPYRPGLRYQHR